eukprot:764975-Hanusia_phi.AAC.1
MNGLVGLGFKLLFVFCLIHLWISVRRTRRQSQSFRSGTAALSAILEKVKNIEVSVRIETTETIFYESETWGECANGQKRTCFPLSTNFSSTPTQSNPQFFSSLRFQGLKSAGILTSSRPEDNGLFCSPGQVPSHLCRDNPSEKDAVLAILVPSKPRYMRAVAMPEGNGGPGEVRSSRQTRWFHNVELVPKQQLSYRKAQGGVRAVSLECEGEEECAGFDNHGNLYRVAQRGDLIHLSNTSNTRFYTKRRISAFPQPFYNSNDKVFQLLDTDTPQDALFVDKWSGSVRHLAERCRNSSQKCFAFEENGRILGKSTFPAFHSMKQDSVLYFREDPGPSDYLIPTVDSILLETDFCNSKKFHGKIHIYVVDTSEDGRNDAATHLAKIYRKMKCVSVLNGFEYGRLQEHSLPAWGVPPNGKRTEVNQTLDIVSAAQIVQSRSPQAFFLLWEDDCKMCAGSLSLLEEALDKIEQAKRSSHPGRAPARPQQGLADFCVLKIGNGGSGLLLNRKYVVEAISFWKQSRGLDNHDVALWKFCISKNLSQYKSKHIYSSHQGQITSFRDTESIKELSKHLWPRKKCLADLNEQWGKYVKCPDNFMHESWMCLTTEDPKKSKGGSKG